MSQVTMQHHHDQLVNRSQRRLLSLAISAALAAGLSAGVQAQTFPPVVQLYSLDGSNGFMFDGEMTGDRSGYSVSAAGDIDGDGIDDLIIGAFGADGNATYSGRSYVVFGKITGFATPLPLSSLDGTDGFILDGAMTGDRFGFSVSTAGDINADGIDDIIVGADRADINGNTNSGRSYVVFGKTTGFASPLPLSSIDGTNGFMLDGVSEYDFTGSSVSGAGDINGDGIDDLIVGANSAYPDGINSGRIYVVFGTTTGFSSPLPLSSLDGSNGFILNGEAAGDGSGRSVSAAGDINGDGVDDLIVGASFADANGIDTGRSYVVFGTTTQFTSPLPLSSLDGSNGFMLDGEVLNDRSGFSVSAAGDINADGVDDLVVGAFRADPNNISQSGRSYVVFGKTTGFSSTLALSSLDGSNGFMLDGAANELSGRSVSSAGDINGDGIDDLIVGALSADPNGSNTGRSYVVFGKTTGFSSPLALSSLDGSNGFMLDGEAAGDQSGWSVSAAGDINDDGIDDLIVGAPSADANGSDSGRSYVVFGGVTGPGLIPAVAITPASLNFGDLELGVQAIETLTLENIGTGTLATAALTFSGPQAGEFSIELNNCAVAQLAAGDTCTVDVGFAPTAPGVRTATLQVDSNAPSSPDFVPQRGSNNLVFADDFE